MKNKLELKKIALLILVLLLLFILFSNYLKSSETKSSSVLPPSEAEKKLPELSKKKENTKNKTQAESEAITAKKKKKDEYFKAEEKVIDSVMDPFKAEKNLKNIKNNDDLNRSIFLEGDLNPTADLRGDGLIIEKENTLKSAEKNQNESEKNVKKNEEIKLKTKTVPAEKEKTKRLQNLKLPFELIGIIKNQNNSAVIILYQGRKIIKKEKERIDLFLIEKIKNKSLIISYKKEKKEIKLWGVQNED